MVFTSHPRTDLLERSTWEGDGKPGHLTGEASIPRSAQHERTGIHIYQPAWDASTDALLWGVFGYQDSTHAYVPQDRFDEVVRDGHWTFAQKGDGCIALWSWREPIWRHPSPSAAAPERSMSSRAMSRVGDRRTTLDEVFAAR